MCHRCIYYTQSTESLICHHRSWKKRCCACQTTTSFGIDNSLPFAALLGGSPSEKHGQDRDVDGDVEGEMER